MSEQNPFIVPGGSSDQAGDSFDPSGRNVDVGRGLEWLKQGWQLFTRNPGMWIAMAIELCCRGLMMRFRQSTSSYYFQKK